MRQLAEAPFWSERHRSIAPRHGGGADTGTFVGSPRAGSRWELHQTSCAIRPYERGAENFLGAIGKNFTTNWLLRANAEAHIAE